MALLPSPKGNGVLCHKNFMKQPTAFQPQDLDKEKIGSLIQERRKSLHLTQKELAMSLFVSDKAVSKWERGLSLPDTAPLLPLSKTLGISITSLLKGQILNEDASMSLMEVDSLMTTTLHLSHEERVDHAENRKKYQKLLLPSVLLCAGEIALLLWYGKSSILLSKVLLPVFLSFIFALWFFS